MPEIHKPLPSRLPQILRLLQQALLYAPRDLEGDLFIHEGEGRLWVTHHDRCIGYLFHPGVQRESQIAPIVQTCGPRLLRLVQALHARWPTEGHLWLSAEQAVWGGPDGLRAVRLDTDLKRQESERHLYVARWRTISQDMEPGRVAISGTLHQRLDTFTRIRPWLGPGWGLSPVPGPMSPGLPGALVVRFPDQAVLCTSGGAYPKIEQAWRLGC